MDDNSLKLIVSIKWVYQNKEENSTEEFPMKQPLFDLLKTNYGKTDADSIESLSVNLNGFIKRTLSEEDYNEGVQLQEVFPKTFKSYFVDHTKSTWYKYIGFLVAEAQNTLIWDESAQQFLCSTTVTAQYTEGDNTQETPPYTNTDAGDGIFNDAEKYYFGIGAPNSEYFLINDINIGDDNDSSTTNDFKFQAADDSSFIVVKEINGFTITENEESLKCIKKGTFPKLNKEHPLVEVDAPGTEEGTVVLKVEYDYWEHFKTGAKIITDIEFTPNLADDDAYTSVHSSSAAAHRRYWQEVHKLDDFPTRLGVVLVGGGGGAGGYKAVDTDGCSCGDGGWKFIPGSTGGGGEIVLGVLNIDCLDIKDIKKIENNITKYYCYVYNTPIYTSSGDHFYVTSYSDVEKLAVSELTVKLVNGQGGKGNKNSSTRGGKSPNEGCEGYDTRLKLNFNVYKAGENSWTAYGVGSTVFADEIRAGGGFGGKAGNYTEGGQMSIFGGGGGGKTPKHVSTDYWYYTGAQPGGDGATIVFMDPPEASYVQEMAAYGKKLYFSKSTPSDTYVYDCTRSKYTDGSLFYCQDDTRKFWVRGGWSLGDGGSGYDTLPNKGGGGSCIRTHGGVGGEDSRKSTGEPTDGANGWLGFYY